jgi:hypothetical protein
VRGAAIAVSVSSLVGCDVVLGLREPVDATVDTSKPPGLVAHYRFEDPSTIAEVTGTHPGTVIDGPFATTAGAVDLAVELASTGHIFVADSPAWDGVGALELWVRPVALAPTELGGILSRDNTGRSDGHFALFQVDSRFFAARLQRSTDGGAGGDGLLLCSEQAPVPGQWMHIGVNFGPPAAELWVDGVLGVRTDLLTVFSSTSTCNQREARSISGNDDPWVFGALSVRSTTGTTDNISDHFTGGALDELVLHEDRQDFASRARR